MESKTTKLKQSMLKEKDKLINLSKSKYMAPSIFKPILFGKKKEINIRTADKDDIKQAFMAVKLLMAATKDLNMSDIHYGCSLDVWLYDIKVRAIEINKETLFNSDIF